jgi:hypothetical protein
MATALCVDCLWLSTSASADTPARNLLVGTLLFLATNAVFFGWAALSSLALAYPALYMGGVFGR